MKIKKPQPRERQFLLLALVPAYFILVGFCMQPPGEILQGIITIIREPDFLITDYFIIGGVGAAFVNAGILTLVSIGIVYGLGMEFDGHTITSACLMFGFSLFGKNLLNIWAIMLGVFLYARYHRTSVSRYIYIGYYGTSLSPIITQVMQMWELPVPVRMVLCILTGTVIGFVLPPLCTHVHYSHKGYSLYNVGFAGGIIATVIVSMFKSFGITIESRLLWSEGNNGLFLILLSVLFGGMILYGVLAERGEAVRGYRNILKCYGLGGTDYYKTEGGSATLINMGVNGLASMFILVALGGELNGPTIGSHFYSSRLQRHGKASEKYSSGYGGGVPCQRGKKLVDYRSVCTAGPSSFYNTGAYCRRIRHSCRSSRRFPPLFRSAECGNRLRGNESV